MNSEQRPRHSCVETVTVDGMPQIRLSGECDLSTAPAVLEHVSAVLSEGCRRVVFDLEHATFLDSSILRVFLDARRSVRGVGQVVLLCRPGFVRRLLNLLELDRVLQVCTPEEWRERLASLH